MWYAREGPTCARLRLDVEFRLDRFITSPLTGENKFRGIFNFNIICRHHLAV